MDAKEAPKTETHVKNPDFSVSGSMCPHQFGFLGKRQKHSVIPDECLTCEKIIDCMAFKSEDTAAKPEIKPSVVERTKDLAGEFGEENKRKRHKNVEAGQDEADGPTKQTSNDGFTVESAGVLHAKWSSTVLIRKETLREWGKVKEVDIETKRGRKMTCKVYPIEDLEAGTIQIPDRVQLKLEVKEGCIVKVKPATSLPQQ